MTTSAKDGSITYRCDAPGCGVVLDAGRLHPDAAIALMRASQWGEAHDGDKPLHYCPEHARA